MSCHHVQGSTSVFKSFMETWKARVMRSLQCWLAGLAGGYTIVMLTKGDSLWMEQAMVMGRRAQREISYLISCESEQFNSERRTCSNL